MMPGTHRNYATTRITSAPPNDAIDKNSTRTFVATLPTERLNVPRRRKPAPRRYPAVPSPVALWTARITPNPSPTLRPSYQRPLHCEICPVRPLPSQSPTTFPIIPHLCYHDITLVHHG